MRQKFAGPYRVLRDGDIACLIPGSLMRRAAEVAASLQFVTHVKLFGEAFYQWQPDYFRRMPNPSGVLVMPLVLTTELIPTAVRPSDIDLLLIPFEGDELVLDHVRAVEVKTIRASVDKEGRYPNSFGFSQAECLLALGFPFVAVAHLIVSDTARRETWSEISQCRVLDSHGRVGEFETVVRDMLPARLIDRAIGRLESNCPEPLLGLLAAHVGRPDLTSMPEAERRAIWTVGARAATRNPKSNPALMRRIAEFYREHAVEFICLNRYDPPN